MDAVSDDGRHALSIIALIGSVFSPYYADARRRFGGADPLEHCSMNVALYGRSRDHWAFTERRRRSVNRSAHVLSIGSSSMAWEGSGLVIDFDELTAPFGARIKGRVRVFPEVYPEVRFALDEEGRHAWWPIAPAARAEVELEEPKLRWKGAAYLDANAGDEPLEDAFRSWSWARVGAKSRAVVTYDVTRKDGSKQLIARAFERDGRVHDEIPLRSASLGPTGWGLARSMYAGPEGAPMLTRTLEDTPFYARSLVEASYLGERAVGTHEELSLERFDSRWVQFLLPFRMRRDTR